MFRGRSKDFFFGGSHLIFNGFSSFTGPVGNDLPGFFTGFRGKEGSGGNADHGSDTGPQDQIFGPASPDILWSRTSEFFYLIG